MARMGVKRSPFEFNSDVVVIHYSHFWNSLSSLFWLLHLDSHTGDQTSVMLLTRGTDPRFPVVLDDAAGLKNEDHRRLGLYLFLAFVLALPAQVPYSLAKIGMKQYDMSWMKCITSSMKILQ